MKCNMTVEELYEAKKRELGVTFGNSAKKIALAFGQYVIDKLECKCQKK